jgi:CheY-like chemotaxis protein
MNAGGKIWMNAQTQYDEVIVSVRDTGVGIDAEMLPHIFKMFTQVDRSKRQAQGGLGIGLTLVRTLVEMHGGSVEARSAGLDQGSEFVVRLPLVRVEPRPDLPAAPAQPAILPSRRVLVVDDNEDAANSMGRLLRLLGAEVAVAHNGYAALEMLSKFQPNVVLLDIGMPGMDGYEVASRIRKQSEWQDLMLIALTGWGQAEDRHRADQAGFNHHLLKPADLDALQNLISSLDGHETEN